MQSSRFQLGTLVVACALLSGGCGGPGYASATVTGSVTIDGAAVPKGYVYFSPISGSPGPVVAAAITDGKYRCEHVPLGKVHVTFLAQAAEPTTVFDKVNNVNHEVPKDILPLACRQGEDANVIAGENLRDFNLKSK